MAAAVMLITTGVIVCLFGYALYRLWTVSTGIGIGLGAGMALSYATGGEIWPIIVGMMIGAALAVTLYSFQTAGTVIAGAVTGFLPPFFILLAANNANWPLALLGAVLGSVCAGLFFHTFMVIGTAVNGATNIVWGLYSLFTGTDLFSLNSAGSSVADMEAGLLVAAMVLLAAVGGAVQSLLLRRRRRTGEAAQRRL